MVEYGLKLGKKSISLGGRCIITRTLEEARYHGMTDEELELVYTPEQIREICSKCENLSC